MAEPMHVRVPARQPANRRPRIPHPHLAPQPAREEDGIPADRRPPLPAQREEPVQPARAAQPDPPPAAPDATDWTPADVPLVRASGRSRRGPERAAPAEKILSVALQLGLAVNGAALLASRLLPTRAFGGWRYGGDDFLLAAAVLLSGYALLAAGRLSRRKDGEG